MNIILETQRLVHENGIDQCISTLESFGIKYKQRGDIYFLYNDKQCFVQKPLSIYNKECNGLVIDKYGSIVCYTMKEPEIVSQEMFDFISRNENIQGSSFLEDGTLVNVWYYDQKWNVSTKTCFDAKNSFYFSNEQSMYDIMDECLRSNGCKIEEFLQELDTNKMYSYVLHHPLAGSRYQSESIYISNTCIRDRSSLFLDKWTSIGNLNGYSRGQALLLDNEERIFLLSQ